MKMNSKVVLVQITEENFNSSMISRVEEEILRANFVGIDTEFTGFGSASISIPNEAADLRYLSLCDSLSKQSLLSIGLSCYTQLPPHPCDPEKPRGVSYSVTTFDFLVHKNEVFEITPEALKFLTKNGFDLNLTFRSGIGFSCKGKTSRHDSLLGNLMKFVLNQSKAIIFHNGFADLILLYHSFIADMPRTIEQFAISLGKDVSSSIYDTKHIARTSANQRSTFLSLLFARCKRESSTFPSNGGRVAISQPIVIGISKEEMNVNEENEEEPPKTRQKLITCTEFATKGYCHEGDSCKFSHSVEDILDAEEDRRKKRRNLQLLPKDLEIAQEAAEISSEISNTTTTTTEISPLIPEPSDIVDICHSSGHDAFATGFVFAYYLEVCNCILDIAKDKICLPGKPFPFFILRASNRKSESTTK